MNIETKKFYTPEEIAELLQLNYRTVLKAIKDNKLHAVRFGKCYRVSGDDLKEFIRIKE